MSMRAMSISKAKRAALTLPLAALVTTFVAAQPAFAQMKEEKTDVEDVARTPLDDLNIDKDEIPQVLLVAEQNPYASAGLTTCNAIRSEIAALDQVLAEDYDTAGSKDTGLRAGNVAKSVVGSFIPFRGIVREVSGAAGDERKLRAAALAGAGATRVLEGNGPFARVQVSSAPQACFLMKTA